MNANIIVRKALDLYLHILASIEDLLHRKERLAIHASQISEDTVARIEVFLFSVNRRDYRQKDVPPEESQNRKYYEDIYTVPVFEWRENGHDWAAAYTVHCGKLKIYTETLVLRDGKRSTVKQVRKSLKRIKRAQKLCKAAQELEVLEGR